LNRIVLINAQASIGPNRKQEIKKRREITPLDTLSLFLTYGTVTLTEKTLKIELPIEVKIMLGEEVDV